MLQVKRTERKFLIDRHEQMQMIRRLDQVMRRDSHATSPEGYEVRTVYFDSLSNRCCIEKEDGLRIHEKIRIRIYGHDDRVIKLESKRKDGDYQLKRSLMIDRALLEELLSGNYAPLLQLEDPMGVYFYEKLAEGMMPKAIIQYQRLSFCLKANDTRITFDSSIGSTESCKDLFRPYLLTYPVLPMDQVVMEVKYNHFLMGYIQNVISSIEQSPTSFSKYYNGRAFCR